MKFPYILCLILQRSQLYWSKYKPQKMTYCWTQNSYSQADWVKDYIWNILLHTCMNANRFMFSVYPRQLKYTGTFTWKPLLEGEIFALINSSLYEYSLYSNEFVVISWNICLYVHTHISSLLCLNLAVWVVHWGHILICTIHLMYMYAQNISLIWITS